MSANLEQVTKLADQLSSTEQLRLVEYLAQRLQRQTANVSQRQPQDLYGIWRNKFSDNFDLDSELKGIRSEWENDFKELIS